MIKLGNVERSSSGSARMSLRRGLSLFVVTLSMLAVGAGVSLVLLTTHLHQATMDMENGLHSVRLAEELQIDLLTYERLSDPVQRATIERNLRHNLHEARQYVNSPDEEMALNTAERSLEGYFSNGHDVGNEGDDNTLNITFEALRRFVEINVEQADASLKESERWDEVGDLIGMGVGTALFIGTAAMLIWLRAVAFRPVFEIRKVIRNFAGGDKTARIPVHGPEELRGIATQFNEMADALARQHHNQAAFLAAVAHDLRNPLSALKVSAEVLSGPSVTSDRLSTLMGVIKRQVNSLDRMVGDLLDSSKIESGNLELRLEDYDARTIAQEAFNLFSPAYKTHHFALSLPDKPISLHCDHLRIEQVLNNLISNAIKYSPGGGRIALSLVESGTEAMFEVSDEGMGIPREDIPYIFEPFRRTRSVREDIPGVGLGLAVARRIVIAHNGRIHVESQIGKGTTFRVYLPAVISRRASA
jgi:two-component system, OmpR family, sensor histidine kinase MtrB